MTTRLVDHIGFSVTDFDSESVTRELTARGATPQMEATTGFYVEDPDGVKVAASVTFTATTHHGCPALSPQEDAHPSDDADDRADPRFVRRAEGLCIASL